MLYDHKSWATTENTSITWLQLRSTALHTPPSLCSFAHIYIHLCIYIYPRWKADTSPLTNAGWIQTDVSLSSSNDCRAHYDCWLPAAKLLSLMSLQIMSSSMCIHPVSVYVWVTKLCVRGFWAERIMLQHCCRVPQALSLCVRCNINKGLHSCGSEIGICKETQKADGLSCAVIWKCVSLNHLNTPKSHFS